MVKVPPRDSEIAHHQVLLSHLLNLSRPVAVSMAAEEAEGQFHLFLLKDIS